MSEAEYEELDLHKVAVDIPKMKSTYFKLNEPAKVQIGLPLFQHGYSYGLNKFAVAIVM